MDKDFIALFYDFRADELRLIGYDVGLAHIDGLVDVAPCVGGVD